MMQYSIMQDNEPISQQGFWGDMGHGPWKSRTPMFSSYILFLE